MSGAPSRSRSRPGSPRLEECRRAGALNAMPKRRSSRSPIGHWHGTTRWLLTVSCQRHCCINPGVSAASTPILLVPRRAGLPMSEGLDSRSVAGFRPLRSHADDARGSGEAPRHLACFQRRRPPAGSRRRRYGLSGGGFGQDACGAGECLHAGHVNQIGPLVKQIRSCAARCAPTSYLPIAKPISCRGAYHPWMVHRARAAI
jgi:hypothetical protein